MPKSAFSFVCHRRTVYIIKTVELPPTWDIALEHICKAYGFLLNQGTFTPADFAARIKEVYDVENPHNRAAVQLLETLEGITL